MIVGRLICLRSWKVKA